MQTKTITVYKIDELSDSAKEHALDNWIGNGDNIAWTQENFDSLNGFAKELGIKIKDASYGGRGEGVTWKMEGKEYLDETLELSGVRLMAGLENNLLHYIRKGKFMYKGGISGTSKTRYSKCQFEISCPFTGYCMDEVLLDPIQAFMKKPDNTTLESLLDDCFHAWVKACNDDVEFQNSMESFVDACEANNYTFTEDGEMENI